jgi:hypothetical protein
MRIVLNMRNMLHREAFRGGLTLIEVLSSIAVAAIGVFGVLVLVPLASRMSQIGVSNEATRQNATNVVERAKSFGALNTNRWVQWNGASFGTPRANSAYCLDPMLISAPSLNPALPTTNTSIINKFPNTVSFSVEPAERVSLRRTSAITLPIGAAMAETMMGQRTMLKTVPAASDLVPPSQAFVRDLATNLPVRRETDGSKSALFLILPANQIGTSVHRMMSIVVANRRFEIDNFDRVFQVRNLDLSIIIEKSGGTIDLILQETDAVSVGANLKSRGWVILVPWYIDVNGIPQYSWQHARPYQVRSSDFDPIRGFTVGLVGSGFVAPSPVSLDPVLYAGQIVPMETRAIYIPDAVDIRETEVRLGTTEY